MTHLKIAGLFAASLLVVLALALAAWSVVHHVDDGEHTVTKGNALVGEDALARLRTVPFYRGLLQPEILRSASIDGGAVHVEIDVPALLRPRLTRSALDGVLDLLPHRARGVLRVAGDGLGNGVVSGESWTFDGPAPLLDVLDRREAGSTTSPVWDAVPATPNAIAAARLLPSQLADPAFGGPALATWRRRAEIAERILGRPLRAEIADDLAGPAVFALYEAAAGNQANGLLVFELKRSDRLRGLLDTVFALGALTERATVRRYRDVATGSFRPGTGGQGIALAVDGPLLLAATSRFLLEAAIDARRGVRRAGVVLDEVRSSGAAWTAIATSAFVAHGWARLARADETTDTPPRSHSARIIPEGESSWRLEGHGPSCAITADPILPFLRSVYAGRQRGSG